LGGGSEGNERNGGGGIFELLIGGFNMLLIPPCRKLPF
jgi:hypothetical protein